MPIRIEPLTETFLPAVRAFNSRLGSEAPFFLPETITPKKSNSDMSSPAIVRTHYLAIDQTEVRGGFLQMDQPAWINGGNRRAANYQSVLSEGIRDRKYSSVSVHMLKYIEQHSPCAFMVGMGNLQNPLPRFLKASGWALREVPFLFRVLNVRKFLRELYVFRKNSYFRLASRAASVSGSGWLGVRLLQGRPAFGDASLRGLLTESVTGWGSWADEIWQQYRAQCSFAVVRDRTTLDLLYPVTDRRLKIVLASRNSSPIGWAVWINTAMKNDKYFGNLRVLTILDCVAAPEFVEAFARLITRRLDESDADLVITNQGHSCWTSAFRKAGFLTSSSNYLLATSKELNTAILAGGGEARIHLTRGDGDGRIHL
jgi:hypothetical protein